MRTVIKVALPLIIFVLHAYRCQHFDHTLCFLPLFLFGLALYGLSRRLSRPSENARTTGAAYTSTAVTAHAQQDAEVKLNLTAL